MFYFHQLGNFMGRKWLHAVSERSEQYMWYCLRCVVPYSSLLIVSCTLCSHSFIIAIVYVTTSLHSLHRLSYSYSYHFLYHSVVYVVSTLCYYNNMYTCTSNCIDFGIIS